MILCITFLISVSALAQEKSPILWDSGDAFLSHCDETNPRWIALSWSTSERAEELNICHLWLVGFMQGIEVLQQLRPAPKPSAAEIKVGADYEKFLKDKFGISPDLTFDPKNICIPETATNEQLRLVVVKWMKEHPNKLGQHASYLAYAALQSAYLCPQ